MSRAVLIAAVAVVAYAAWRMSQDQGAATAGDDNSNPLTDTYDDMQNLLTGWPSGSAPYQDIITSAAQANGVPVSILAWLLWKESRYDPSAVNKRTGALGIAQFMPATATQYLGSSSAALDPSQAIPGAARMLADLYNSTGDWTQTLAAYNWGIGNVQRKGIAAAPAETVDYYTTILGKAGYEVTA